MPGILDTSKLCLLSEPRICQIYFAWGLDDGFSRSRCTHSLATSAKHEVEKLSTLPTGVHNSRTSNVDFATLRVQPFW